MSKILEKPFDWSKRIVRAVFRGRPNLLTTSDLNRQIEALKKEMFCLQQNAGVISDFQVNHISSPGSSNNPYVKVSCSYIYCGGSKVYEDSQDELVQINIEESCWNSSELLIILTATQKIIGYDDDFSHEISGATFEDGQTLPSADHIVYTEPKFSIIPKTKIMDDFPDEYVCTLAKISFITTHNGYKKGFAQLYASPIGSSCYDNKQTYNRSYFFCDTAGGYGEDCDVNEVYKEKIDFYDDWRSAIDKIWKRQYLLEKRLFYETVPKTVPEKITYKTNSEGVLKTFITNRTHTKSFARKTSNGYSFRYEIEYSYRVIGNICFLHILVKTLYHESGNEGISNTSHSIINTCVFKDHGSSISDTILKPLENTACNVYPFMPGKSENTWGYENYSDKGRPLYAVIDTDGILQITMSHNKGSRMEQDGSLIDTDNNGETLENYWIVNTGNFIISACYPISSAGFWGGIQADNGMSLGYDDGRYLNVVKSTSPINEVEVSDYDKDTGGTVSGDFTL